MSDISPPPPLLLIFLICFSHLLVVPMKKNPNAKDDKQLCHHGNAANESRGCRSCVMSTKYKIHCVVSTLKWNAHFGIQLYLNHSPHL